MKTQSEIQKAVYNLIEDVITLTVNVKNGCYSDQKELSEKKARLAGAKRWLIENNLINDVKHWFGANNFGHHKQFVASELSNFFN